MTFVLGVDGGNSKTLAVLADEHGEIHGVGRSGSGSHQSSPGLEGAMHQIRIAVAGALKGTGCDVGNIVGAYYCLAGADLPEDFALLRPALEKLGLSQPTELNNDSIAALRSGTNNPNAVVVILGAGTNGAGRNASGQEIRLPALGWISGDWGGGAELARESIRAVARAWDGRGPPTALTPIVLEALDVPDAEQMIRALYLQQRDWDRILAIPPRVFEAAESGDAVARDLIVRSGVEVACTATTLLRRLDLLENDADVVLGGSVFRGTGPLLLDTIREHIYPIGPKARIVRPDIEPVLGSLFLAMDMVGLLVDEDTRARAKRSYERLVGSKVEERAL